jgi:hypothetical protein
MQAIITKYLGFTETKPARIKATAEAGSITLSWDEGISDDANHWKAAKAIIDKFDWHYGDYVMGGLPNSHGASVFVCAVPETTYKVTS